MPATKKDRSMRNLRKSGQQYQVRRQLPADVVDHFQKKWWVKNTGVSDWLKAAKLRDLWLAELDQQIEEVRAGRQCIDAAMHEEYLATRDLEPDDDRRMAIEHALLAEADGKEDRGEDSVFWYRKVTGVWTPLDQHLEQFLRESKVSNVTKKARRSAVRKLMSWMRQPVLQKLTRRQAGAYITHLTDTGISPVTVNGIISNLASYQKYLVKRGLAKENVWSGQHLPTKGAKQERIPWETEEIMRMIQNAPTRLLLDLVLFGALTGMRCNELAQLRLDDCVDGFNVRDEHAKTTAGIRHIPKHPQLVDAFCKRTSGKSRRDYIFHEITAKEENRGKALTKRFSRWRTKLFGEVEGRQSPKCFHSFRHHFIDERLRAGIDLRLIQMVVGHQPEGGVTTNAYGHGLSEDQARTVVDAASLPL
ncbi:MAG: tyrosine-type recombinase/integrase [Hyphomicrobium sp.]|jgi:site-specific recombinase XerD